MYVAHGPAQDFDLILLNVSDCLDTVSLAALAESCTNFKDKVTDEPSHRREVWVDSKPHDRHGRGQ